MTSERQPAQPTPDQIAQRAEELDQRVEDAFNDRRALRAILAEVEADAELPEDVRWDIGGRATNYLLGLDGLP